MYLVRQVRCADAEHSRTRFGLTERPRAHTVTWPLPAPVDDPVQVVSGGTGAQVDQARGCGPSRRSVASSCGHSDETMRMNACRKKDNHPSLVPSREEKTSQARTRPAPGVDPWRELARLAEAPRAGTH